MGGYRMVTDKRYLMTTALCLVGALAAPASAQEGRPADVADVSDEIVVTGLKRVGGVSVFEAPVAVTAVGPQQLEDAHVAKLSDLSAMVPNVYLNGTITNPGTATFAVRGMAVYSTIPTATPAVGVFVDEVYLGINAGAVLDTFDLEGVEVLRGPQGLLFGRNVTGGALLVRTKTPTDKLEINANISVESGPNYTAWSSVSGPLDDEGVWSGKIAFYTNHDKGYFTNLANGNKNLGESETYVGRAALAWRPNSDFRSILRVERGSINGDGPAGQNHRAFSRKSFDVAIDEEGLIDIEWNHYTLDTRIDVPFGDGEIVNIVSFRNLNQYGVTDIDSTPIHQFHAKVYIDQEQFSEELRYSGSFGPVDLSAGVFYYDDSIFYLENRTLFAGATDVTGGGVQDSKTWAVFSNFDVDIGSGWTINIGARYSEETKKASVNRLRPSGPTNLCNLVSRECVGYTDPVNSFPNAGNPNSSEKWGAFTPKLGLQWEPTSDLRAYALWTRSYRSGGYNLRLSSAIAPGVPGPYDQESVDSFELGFKQRAFDGRLKTSLALFHNRYRDLQRDVASLDPLLGTLQLTANTADVTINGVEAEATLDIGEGLSIEGNIGYLDAKIKDVRFDLSGNGTIGPEDYALDLPFVSPWSYAVAVNYEKDVDFGRLRMRVSYSHRDGAASNDPNTGLLNPVDNVDANLSVETRNERLIFSIYGRNLLDRATFGVDTPVPFNTPATSPFGSQPQTFSPLNKGRVFGASIKFSY